MYLYNISFQRTQECSEGVNLHFLQSVYISEAKFKLNQIEDKIMSELYSLFTNYPQESDCDHYENLDCKSLSLLTKESFDIGMNVKISQTFILSFQNVKLL